jgi:hypothetical protein
MGIGCEPRLLLHQPLLAGLHVGSGTPHGKCRREKWRTSSKTKHNAAQILKLKQLLQKN